MKLTFFFSHVPEISKVCLKEELSVATTAMVFRAIKDVLTTETTNPAMYSVFEQSPKLTIKTRRRCCTGEVATSLLMEFGNENRGK
ncbi:Hypothetical predicted protein [Octopus vulgaris]|uniref:Uncharacterized protein n=1 Tax=Octopus vulgaris TaxID=6645 RepID=A0AA36AXC4_OCTVU|nr:Hypothetical predicted protein [Octopus vulgaris]